MVSDVLDWRDGSAFMCTRKRPEPRRVPGGARLRAGRASTVDLEVDAVAPRGAAPSWYWWTDILGRKSCHQPGGGKANCEQPEEGGSCPKLLPPSQGIVQAPISAPKPCFPCGRARSLASRQNRATYTARCDRAAGWCPRCTAVTGWSWSPGYRRRPAGQHWSVD